MTIFGMTDTAIAEDIGKRLRDLRLGQNFSQEEIAQNSGISLKAVRNAEAGKSTLVTYIKILRVLNALDHLETFIPPAGMSPLELARMAGRKRQRASKKRK